MYVAACLMQEDIKRRYLPRAALSGLELAMAVRNIGLLYEYSYVPLLIPLTSRYLAATESESGISEVMV